MLIDRSLRLTLRNFSTLFFVVAALTIPLHLAYSLVFGNVIATRELQDEIRAFPEHRQVRSVGRDQLRNSLIGFTLVTVIELAAIPFLVRATHRVLADDAEGEIPTAIEALRGIGHRQDPQSFVPGAAGTIAAAAALCIVIGWLFERNGLLLLEFVSDARSFPFYGLVQGVSRAVAAPFFLVTWVCAHDTRTTSTSGGSDPFSRPPSVERG